MPFDLALVIEELNRMIGDGVVDAYAVGGAVAANIYVEAATTEDVDVFVVFKPGSSLILDPTPVLHYFTSKGYVMKDDRVIIGGWPVQFLPPPGALEEEAMQHAVILEDDDGPPLRVFSAEHVAAVALKTGRPKDLMRLLQFLEGSVLDRGLFDEIVSRHGLTGKWLDFKRKFEPTEP
jgi:hypothetical protein